MRPAIELFKSRPGYRRLWAGNVVSQLGDWIGWVAVSVLALQHGGGALGVALVFAAHHLPAAAVTPVAGVLADRFDRRTVLVGTSLVLGALTLGMVAAAAMGALALLTVLLMVRSALNAFFAPAERAALPRLVSRDELLLAGSLDAGTWSVVFSLGMALGGVLVMLGPVLALAIDAATFLVAAALLRGLPSIPPQRDETVEPKRRVNPFRAFVRDLADAARYALRNPVLRRAVFAKGPLALAGGAAWLALAVRADALLGAALGFGLFNALRGVGTGVGPALVASAIHRGARRLPVWTAGYLVALVGMVAFAWAPSLALALVAVFAWGLGSGANWVLSTERIQALGPDAMQARLGAFDQTLMVVGQVLGALGLALWTEAGAGVGFGITGLAVLAAVAWVWLAWPARRSSMMWGTWTADV